MKIALDLGADYVETRHYCRKGELVTKRSRSEKDGKTYAGYTKDLNLRFEQHNNGAVETTKYRRQLKLIYFEACLNQKDALK